MSYVVVESNPRAIEISFSNDALTVQLADGRAITVPLVWFPVLLDATLEEREDFRIIGDGEYINWPKLDEDLSISGLLRGSHTAS